MGDRLATIDMDRKVGGCCAHFCGGTAAAHFSAYIGFGPTLPALRHGLMIDENQPVRVETNNFMRVVRLCLIPITGIRDSPSIWLPITVLSLQDLKILLSIFHLLEPPEQLVPELSICTTIIHDFCIPFPTLMNHYSQHFLPFSASSSPSIPFSSIRSSNGQWGDLEWFTPHHVSACGPWDLCLPTIPQQTWAENLGWLCPFSGEGELGPHLTQRRLGWGLPPYQVAPLFIQQFGHNRHGPKIGRGSAPLLGRGCWVPI